MLWWFAQNALISGLLAAVVALLCRIGRFSPAVKHALWLLVLIKLMTPPFAWYRVPRSVDALVAAWPSRAVARQEQPEPRRADSSVVASAIADDVRAGWAEPRELHRWRQRDGETESVSQFRPSAPAVPSFGPSVARRWYSLCSADPTCALLMVWLLGAVPLATVQIIRLFRLWRLTRHSMPAPAWLDRIVRQTAARLKVRPPQVAVVPALCSPLVYALGRPRLLWPAALSDQLTHDARRAVVLHELAHLRRRDHWVAWLELTAGWVWWFNPVYWYARRQLRENAELACDAWVVGLLPSGRRAYALALIEVTEFVSSAPAALPAVAMGNVARSSLERRLTMILRERISYRMPLAGAGLIGLTLLSVLPGWSRGQAPDKTAAPSTTPPVSNGGVATEPGAANPVRRELRLEALSDQVFERELVGLAQGGAPGVAEAAKPEAASADDIAQPQPAGGDEQRIAQLEAKLAQLLELLERRGITQSGSAALPPASRSAMGSADLARQLPAGVHYVQVDPNIKARLFAFSPQGRLRIDSERVETLTRARYKLPEATAAALAAFIKEQVKTDAEAKADGETLTVTASEEDQSRIAGFVELLREHRATVRIENDLRALPVQPAGTGQPSPRTP